MKSVVLSHTPAAINLEKIRMNRKLLTLAIGISIGANIAHAADNIPTVYGKVDLTLNHYNYDRFANATTSYTAQDNWKLESNSSRLGVKGDYPIAGTIKVIYKLEYEIYPDSDKQGDNGSDFKQRNTYGGIQGDWGTLFAGKNDTPLKAIAAETVQMFKDLPLADYKYLLVGENRENNIIQYATPNLSGVVFSAQIEPGEDSGSNDKAGTTITTHTNHSLVNKYSTAVTYKLDKLYLALADDHNVLNTNTVRAVGQYGIGPVTLGALWQKADRNYSTIPNTAAITGTGTTASPQYPVGTTLVAASLGSLTTLPAANNNTAFNPITDFTNSYKSQDGYAISAAWNFMQDWTLKGQYIHSTSEPDSSLKLSDTKAKQYALGVDYKINTNAKLFAYYAAIDTQGDRSKFDGTLKDKTFAVGYDLKF